MQLSCGKPLNPLSIQHMTPALNCPHFLHRSLDILLAFVANVSYDVTTKFLKGVNHA